MAKQDAAVQSKDKNQSEPFTPPDWEKYYDQANWHEAAKILPMLTADELQALVDDIREHCLLNHIVLADGKVVDGRNRLLACRAAGVTSTFVELKETTLSRLEWVIAQNIRRRHLTPTQLAVVAYDAVPLFKTEAKKRQQAHGGTAPGKSKNTSGENSASDHAEGLTARTQAAKSVGVNEHYVSDVWRIYENAPTLLQPMRLGSLTIPQALKQIAGQKEKRLDKIRARAYHKNDESLPTLREKLIESGGVYLIKYSQVHHDSEKVEAELERISATLWETFENNNTKRPGLENSADSDTIEID